MIDHDYITSCRRSVRIAYPCIVYWRRLQIQTGATGIVDNIMHYSYVEA